MPRILFSLCLLVWLGVPAPAVRAAPPADYFPLVPGTVWIYRTNIGQDLIMTVGGVGQVGGVACRVLEGIINGMLTQRECYRRNGGTVYAYVRAYPQGNVVLTPPQPMLVLPPKVGHGWVWEGKAGEAPARVVSIRLLLTTQFSTISPSIAIRPSMRLPATTTSNSPEARIAT